MLKSHIEGFGFESKCCLWFHISANMYPGSQLLTFSSNLEIFSWFQKHSCVSNLPSNSLQVPYFLSVFKYLCPPELFWVFLSSHFPLFCCIISLTFMYSVLSLCWWLPNPHLQLTHLFLASDPYLHMFLGFLHLYVLNASSPDLSSSPRTQLIPLSPAASPMFSRLVSVISIHLLDKEEIRTSSLYTSSPKSWSYLWRPSQNSATQNWYHR